MQAATALTKDVSDDLIRHSVCSDDINVLTRIYEQNVNIAIWQRQLSAAVIADVENLLETTSSLNKSAFIHAKTINEDIRDALTLHNAGDAFIDYTAELVDIFCTLFELDEVGFRLRILDAPMCPRFHVDHVPCRLVTTFAGKGTQWLEHDKVNRDKLGHGSKGLEDGVSGLYAQRTDIKSMNTGDVALLKGETWMGNDLAGVVHRSPAYEAKQNRLLLTLDFLN
ncbi:MAG: DUF1826 domain-containing protein [Aliiglaciecola sp.]|uniref:DUF1826 domain-containing protein n=1 Tax=Aliiglaciecola sp. TaxID=1872441 RepID=UPI003298C84E